jgi:hypothetical protein
MIGDDFLDAGTTARIETLYASVRRQPRWLDDLVVLTRGLTGA